MATVNNQGGVSTQGSRTFYFGSSSGLDTAALIEAAYNQRISEATRNDTRITTNDTRVSALTTLQTLSKSMQTALAGLRTNYSLLADPSAFSLKSGTLTTATTGINPSSFLGVSIENDAVAGNYSVQVSALATAHKVRSGSFADPNAVRNVTGTFTLGQEGAAAASISVTSGMSLNDIAAAINAQKATSNISASVLQVAPGQYQLFLTAADTNKAITNSAVAGDALFDLGITLASGGGEYTNNYINEVQPPAGSEIIVDGVTFLRDSNSFSDVIDGVNFDLLTANPGVTFNLKIGNDTAAVKDKILDFTETYNELRDFILSNQAVQSNGAVSEEAILFGDNQLNGLTNGVQGILAGMFGEGGTNMATLRELGITQGGDGKLIVDQSKLDTAIATKFDQVKDIFSTKITNPNTNFRMSGNTSLLKSATMNFDITYSGSAITNVSVNGDSSLFDINGTSIIGKKGSIYEGMSFAYVGTTSTTFTFGINQGMADLLDNQLNRFSDTITGSLEIEKQRLNDLSKALEARSATVRERGEDFRNALIDRYARFEAKINASNSVLAQIKAILGTDDDN